ncbi:MAG: amidohydrolase family protein [Chloroflexi bacterium]|nr:amidohydrolase family protein [Chloroflexota bacterium]
MPSPTTLPELAARLPLLDHHCHGVFLHDPSDAAFEALISETSEPPAPGTSRWDTPVGLAIRRWCAPVLDLDPFPTPAEYLARRRALGGVEASRRLLLACGTEGLLLDTGLWVAEIADPARMAALTGRPAWEIVRIESIAEAVATSGVTAAGFGAAFRDALAARSAEPGVIGFKTIIAYRGGFDVDPVPPTAQEVEATAGRWLRDVERGRVRLTERAILRFGIWTAAELGRERGLPLQVHAGYGDPDLTLHLANPSLLTDLLRRLGALGVEVVLLHCFPYHREAAYLADMFPHVSFDLGLALTFAGASGWRMLGEALEVAPFTKLLYSSDGYGAAELHHLGAVHFRRALGRVLDGWIVNDACTPSEAERIARLFTSENAHRIYPRLAN